MQTDHAMAALSALKVGGGSPNVCFAALRPPTKNSGLSASRQKYVRYLRCSESTTEQNDVVFKPPTVVSDSCASALLCAFSKQWKTRMRCLLLPCDFKYMRHLRSFSPTKIIRIFILREHIGVLHRVFIMIHAIQICNRIKPYAH